MPGRASAAMRDADLLAQGRASDLNVQAIATAANRLERATAKRPVDLLAQALDVGVDDVGAVLVGLIPRGLEKVDPRKHLSGPCHECLEEQQLLGRERETGPT